MSARYRKERYGRWRPSASERTQTLSGEAAAAAVAAAAVAARVAAELTGVTDGDMYACDACGLPFIDDRDPSRGVRFCSQECSDTWWEEQERKAVERS